MSNFKSLRQVLLTGMIALSVALVGCAGQGQKEKTGRGVGAVIGGLIGAASGDNNRGARVLVGALVGSLIGGSIGKSMDARDRANQRTALESNRTNQPMAWTNPDSGNRYRVTPTRTYRSANNAPCREYETEAFVRGQRQVFRGRACRDNSGNWSEVRGNG